MKKNNVFILSAPSGAGKSTLISLVLNSIPSLFFSVSHTTRAPREGEQEGIDYYFVDVPTFRTMIQSDQFLEWAHVHGYYYGTSMEMVSIAEAAGKDLILDIDVQGAQLVRQKLHDAIGIFILPPTYEELERRLMLRQKDSHEVVQQRLETARQEIDRYHEYDYVVINADIKEAFENLAGIIRGQGQRRVVQEEKIRNILKSFNRNV